MDAMSHKIFRNSNLYKVGQFYRQFGVLLTNPNTTIEELVEFVDKHNLKIDFKLSRKENGSPDTSSTT
jgi:hypothetical protein